MHPCTPPLPWQGSSGGEGAEKQLSCATDNSFLLQPDEWEGRRGGPRAGLRLAGTGGWARREGGKEEREREKTNTTHYLQEGFPQSIPTCHHPGTVRNDNKSRSHGSCPVPLPFSTASRQQLPDPSPSQQRSSPPASLQAKKSLMARAAAPTQLTFISFLSKWSWRKWSRVKE